MNKKLLRDLMVLKLKIIDEILDSIPVVSESGVKKHYEDFVNAVNEATGDYIKETKADEKKKSEKKLKNIDIE